MPRRTVAVLPLAAVLAACGSAAPDRAAPDGAARSEAPAGVVDAGRTALYTARIDARAGETRVTARRPADGRELRAATLPGRWVIPAVAGRDRAGALSGDGGTVALAGPRGEGTSTFALLGTRFAAEPRTFTLRGRWSFDALSPDARVVYLLEHAEAGHYRVRAYDAAAGRLRSGAIVEKGETEADMTGAPLAREIAPGGSPVYTLYRRPAGDAFVHALDTRHGVAVCVDLPAGGAWRLAWSRGGERLDAVDGLSGRRVRVAVA
ncbi:MAG: hypothetical protein QOF04_103 [Solirubrobacteraceae bacterium]|nr:hypothetical protein [Solirubrobacteraceae bacterium]